ncbi:MAG: CDP-alcohol phosphatidyltransferase family protein [Planctomycetaceae bacterium]|nr:CDP-alcohol phosphatidyltransferase family protein [Planctomycetaceae bacterium]MCB9950861.1 CDP-alcohol phosphatidyltransferase family protein [Planctomycetaceae bacterium]
MSELPETSRRPVGSRNTGWAAAIAGWLARRGVRPNTISLMSVVFGALAGGCLVLAGRQDAALTRIGCLLGAAASIQLRLLCNLFDGMVAVEHGMKSKSGEIFNELPDRFADLFILLGAGFVDDLAWSVQLGWCAATLAVLTAYVRALGASAGAGQHFLGPMAKQHRMAAMTICCLLGIVSAASAWNLPIMSWGLGLIIIGCLITVARRTVRIVRTLESA